MATIKNKLFIDKLTNASISYINSPIKTLSAWIALEVLSPQTFNKLEELAPGGNTKLISTCNKGILPWEKFDTLTPPRNTKPYYEIILGTIELNKAVNLLLDKYIDDRIERQKLKSEAIIATIMVDKNGIPIKENALNISSFAWGISIALNDKLQNLSTWPHIEKKLIENLESQIYIKNTNGDIEPLNFNIINKIFDYYTNLINLPYETTRPPYIVITRFQSINSKDSPEPLLLNSFFLNDLSEAMKLFNNNNVNENLKRYLGVKNYSNKIDLLKDNKALMDALSPTNIPLSRWPGNGRHPLVLLQQAAVNLATTELRDKGILSINGPPGTGKTTLLRDLVADIVTKRAIALTKFSDPSQAFTKTSEKIECNKKQLSVYRIDDSLKGYEIIIASSNNKAVENVSTELPSINAIASDSDDLRYFSTISDQLLKQDTWGLISAVLGNSKNKQAFKEIFFWHKDFGLETYLSSALGKFKPYTESNPKTGEVIVNRTPRVVTNEKPPKNAYEARARWHNSIQEFNKLLEKSQKQLDNLESLRNNFEKFSKILKNNSDKKNIYLNLYSSYESTYDEFIFNIHSKGFFGKLRILFSYKLIKALILKWIYKFKYKQLNKIYKKSYTKYIQIIYKSKFSYQDFDKHIIDYLLFNKEHNELHKVAPWINKEQHTIRDEVFTAAMKLHKAFIDACPYYIKYNLGILMSVFSGNTLTDLQKAKLMPDLWSTFFLVVPSISTTFASIDKMFPKIPSNTFGWLLIDEAGQALPQAAVGAIMRTKRAVVVGDPLQIEPVVNLPETLTKAICKEFKVDPDKFNAPKASVQTLADQATKYNAKIGELPSRTVGVPLLVHRRCNEPMFSISNSIAYDGLMVNAKSKSVSSIKQCLGDSTWFDIQGNPTGKWCYEEGELVLQLLNKLKSNNVQPNLYIITPFLMVSHNLKMMIYNSKILDNWVDNKNWCNERIGTVHTAQGREAEAVILVLGATCHNQNGARNWAGKEPNLLNVAVTRAKEVLYVVGNRSLWKGAGLFNELDSSM